MIATHNDQLKALEDHKTKASIRSLPIDVVIMTLETLSLKDALVLCDVLELPEQVSDKKRCIRIYPFTICYTIVEIF
jgi:hypothetical protein